MNTEVVESPFAAQQARTNSVTESAGARQSQSRELAEMQTKYLMAQQFRRDERAAMDGIINAFSRPGLAERSQYQFARGGSDITGPSIHAAQAIAQQWGNMEFGWREISRGVGADGVPYSEVEAFAVDLQSRTRRPIGFIVKHWRDRKNGTGYPLKEERDIYELCANQAQRRARACILAVIPQDVVDAAMEQAAMTLKAKADTSPAAMVKMVEAFSTFGVTKEHIEKRIQRRLDAITASQVVQLKRIFASLRDEMSEPREWFEIEAETPPPPAGLDAVRQAAASKKASAKSTPPTGGSQPGAVGTGVSSIAQYKAQIDNATSADGAQLVLDEARDVLDASDNAALGEHYTARWEK